MPVINAVLAMDWLSVLAGWIEIGRFEDCLLRLGYQLAPIQNAQRPSLKGTLGS